MRVERFLADAQLLRQIVHGHTAKPVTKKVGARSVDNSLAVWITLSVSRSRFVCRFHIHYSLITMSETNPVYLVSRFDCRCFDVSFFTQAAVSWGKSKATLNR
jgi:hypothetical protein